MCLGANARSEFYFAGRERGRLWCGRVVESVSEHHRGVELLTGKLGEGCFSLISDELDRVDEVFFL